MAKDTKARHAALREKLIDVAEAQIAQQGLHTLKARDVARSAGCALGAIYTHFDDLPSLTMAVNGRTFRRLGAFVADAVARAPAGTPNDHLVVLGHAYLHFAVDNTNVWRALFDLEMSVDQPVPDWYLQELATLFSQIAAPLSELAPAASADDRDLMVRTLFSSVHGIVLLGLEKRISAVPMERLETMIELLLRDFGA